MLPTGLSVSSADLMPLRLYHHVAFNSLYWWSVDTEECPSHVNSIIVLNECSSCRMIGRNILIIITMLVYLYCAAYTWMTMNESSPPCEQRNIILNDDGQRVQLARPELPAPHYICMYRLLPTTPPSPSRHYYPPTYSRYKFTDPERMDSLVS